MSAAVDMLDEDEGLPTLQAPFPYFGGKSRIARTVWRKLGTPQHYIEPFCGSAAMLLAAPRTASLEVVGDLNGYLVNFWRAVKFQPAQTWAWADYPVSHIDLTARHQWLVEPARVAALMANLADPEWPGDPQVAGWWLWGQCSWIGSGWCTWGAVPKRAPRQIPHLGNNGVGVQAMTREGQGLDILQRLSARLARVRLIHSTWDACLNTNCGGERGTAAFLDPPYKGFEALYRTGSEPLVASAVEEWARAHGRMRIALCGHLGDYNLPGWEFFRWEREGATFNSTKTKAREAVWFSPGCKR